MAAKPSNSAVVPASPHFFGDQVRRRDILAALRDGRPPDYSRGFSSRPQLRGSTELAGTEYDDGWGAHCYLPGMKAADNDKSFRTWTCAEGLACQVAGEELPHRHVFCQKSIVSSAVNGDRPMSSSDQENKERNRQIADNEAERQMVGAARVSIWAIAVAVIAGVICVGLVWMWLNR